MNQLLKGLLAASPEERLSARQALRLPVFDKFRGSQLPELSSPTKSSQFHYCDEDTDVFDEGSPVMDSIKSLEGRSIILKKPMDMMSQTGSYSPSVRWEGESVGEKPSPSFNKRPLQMRLHPGVQGDLMDCRPMPRQESFDTESKFSADEKMSPPGSPGLKKKIQFSGAGQKQFLTPQMQPRQISLFGTKPPVPLPGADLFKK